MSVEIINLAATQAPRPGRKADAGGADDGARFDAALTLRRAPSVGQHNAEDAAGLKPVVSGPPGKGDGNAAHHGLRPVTSSQLLQLAERLNLGAAATADAKAPGPRLGASAGEPRLEHGRQTALEPLPEISTDADIVDLAGGLVEEPRARPAPADQSLVEVEAQPEARAAHTAPAQNAALIDNAATAGVAALQQATPRAAGEAVNDKAAVPGRRLHAHAETRSTTVVPGAAVAGEQITEAALESDAPRAASQREAFLLAANTPRPAGAPLEGKALPGSGEPTSFTTALNAHAPAAQAAPAVSTAAASAPPPMFSAQLNAPMGSEAWNQAINQQSLRLSHFGDGSAQLTLHPRELGQIQVTLKMGEQAQLHFASPNAQVRAAVEAALPQLRNAFADSGINLGQASVSDQGSGQSSFNSEQQPQSRRGGPSAQPLDEASAPPVNITTIAGRTQAGGIDIFA